MRDVLDAIEGLGIRYYMTGSEALGRYAQPRQTMDIDLVLGLRPSEFGRLGRLLEDRWLVADPLDFRGHTMASAISRYELVKVDLILQRETPWAIEAMERREPWDHPVHGPTWVISIEDLLLAKLEWSEGTSELQLRDCRSLIALNRERLDWEYVARHAPGLGVDSLSRRLRDAS